MVRRREELSEGKKQIIAGLLDEYDIQSAEDIQKRAGGFTGASHPVDARERDERASRL